MNTCDIGPVVIGSAVLALVLAAAPARADGCGPLTEALIKGLNTPWRAVMVSSGGGLMPSRVDLVATRDKFYSKDLSGQWKTRVRTADIGDARVRRDWANRTCTSSDPDAVDGEPADVFFHRESGQAFDTVTKYWISRASGLVLKTEAVRGQGVVTTTYDYSDVSPPPD